MTISSPGASMRRIIVLTRKELLSWFSSPALYGITVFFLVFISVWFFYIQRFFAMDIASLRPFFEAFPLAFIFIIPVITMKAWAEEKKLGSVEILFTMPFNEWELVMGKFLSSLIIIILMLLLTLPVPLSLLPLSYFDLGVMLTEYTGVLLLGATALSVGLFLSGIAKTQAAAFVGSVVVLLALMLLNNFTANLPPLLINFINFISLSFHFESFSRGLLDSRDLSFFLLTTLLFLFLNTRILIYRKWS
ncbi:MAG: ABC transporter permease subunit [Treponema sp.]|nr:ABC transporter permease subunit [Treponema sp.]